MGRLLRWGLFLATLGAIAYVALQVDLTPKVESNFFFATDANAGENPFAQAKPQVLLSLASPDLRSPEYAGRVRALAADLRALTGQPTMDIAHGPKDLDDAMASPFWRRLLIAEDERATLMIVQLDGNPRVLIPKVEEVVAQHHRPDFRVTVSGVPYVVELITRHLFLDLKTLLFATLAVFTVLILVLFRSLSILAGTLVACLTSCIGTLGAMFAIGMKPGILTGNVLAISFVMALSHIVFLTTNWVHSGSDVKEAVRWTGWPSFWSMATTLLGFLTLLLATAKPLREFGTAGSIACGVSMICAYLIFPLYLRSARAAKPLTGALGFLGNRNLWAVAVAFLLLGTAVYGIRRINHDPSLLSYFRDGSDIQRGLEEMDVRAGSTTLDLVVREPGAPKITNPKSWRRLRELHADLEKDPAIGSALSLPVIDEELLRQINALNPPEFLKPGLEKRISILEQKEFKLLGRSFPTYEIGRYFITTDRTHAVYKFRMRESAPVIDRKAKMREITELARRHGFEVAYFSGLYEQMGRLSGLVMDSVMLSLAGLLVLFAIVSFIVARKATWALAMCFGLVTVAGCVLGVIGLFRWPVDIISSTAVNVAIGMGIDGMIHLVTYVRRRKASWAEAKVAMGHPILASSLIVAGGFAMFALSSFPPTQRFGLFVMLGMLVSAFVILLVLPRPFARLSTPPASAAPPPASSDPRPA